MEASCGLVAFLCALLIQTAAAAPAPSNSSTTETRSMVALLVTTSGHWQLHSMKFLITTSTVVRAPTPSLMFPTLDSFHHLWAPTSTVKLAVVLVRLTNTILKILCGMGRGVGSSQPAVKATGSHGSARNCQHM